MTWRASHAAPPCVQGRKDARVSEDGSEDPAGDYLHVETGKQIKWEDSTKLIHQHILPHTLSLSVSLHLSVYLVLSLSLSLPLLPRTRSGFEYEGKNYHKLELLR